MRFFIPVLCVLFFYSCKSKNDTNKKKAINWVMAEKRIFKNALTKEGKLDTVYMTKYIYKGGDLADSVQTFYVFSYEGELVKGRTFYNISNDLKPTLKGSTAYNYDARGNMISSELTNSGIVELQEKHEYDLGGRPIKYAGKQLKRTNKSLNDEEEDDELNSEIPSNIDYEEVNVKYEYEKDGKLTRSIATDLDGKLVRTDINLYTGDLPLASYSLNMKGDTIQRIDYKMEDKMMKLIVKSEDYIITKWVSGNWIMAQITEDLKMNKKYKKVFKYGEKGRKTEQILYVAG